jgi:hypothetical protein
LQLNNQCGAWSLSEKIEGFEVTRIIHTYYLNELRIKNYRSFSVVPPCEVFASLFSNTALEYRQKNPLKFSILSCYNQFYNYHTLWVLPQFQIIVIPACPESFQKDLRLPKAFAIAGMILNV